MSSCKVHQLGPGLGMEESSHGCTAARTWHLAEVLYLSISQTASRDKGRGKDKASPEWYFQAQWVESLS